VKTNEESSWKDYAPEASGILAALGTYAALRRFRPSLTNARLRKVQEAGKDGWHVASPANSTKNKILWGADSIGESGKGGLVLNENIGSGAKSSIGMTINPDRVHHALADKGNFGKIMKEEGLQDAIPATEFLDEVLSNKGIAKQFKGKNTYVKSRYDSRAADEASDAVFPNLDEAKGMDLEKPRDYIVQEKMPVSDEFRVHYVAGEPFAINKRWLPEPLANISRKISKVLGKDFAGGGYWPAAAKDRAELSEFMKKSLDPLKKRFGDNEEIFGGFDVIKTPQGYKIVDQNTAPATIDNPLASRKLQRLLTGRWGKDVSGAAALGAGGLAATGAHLGVRDER
jgi:hypothetical protein